MGVGLRLLSSVRQSHCVRVIFRRPKTAGSSPNRFEATDQTNRLDAARQCMDPILLRDDDQHVPSEWTIEVSDARKQKQTKVKYRVRRRKIRLYMNIRRLREPARLLRSSALFL